MAIPLLALLLLWQASGPAPSAPAVPAHLKEAAELVAAGQFGAAQEKLAVLDATLPGVQHLRGVIHFNRKEYAPAAEALTKAVATEAPASGAYRESTLLIGQSHYLTSKFGEAVPWLEKARAAGADSAEVTYMLGTSHIHQAQPDKAATAFATMFGVPPQSAAALLLTAQMMFRLEYLEQAEPLLRKALALDARLPGAHQLLGEMATFRNDVDKAVAELSEELAVNPNSFNAYYKLGDAHSRREDWAQAMPALQKAVWLNPYHSGPYILLGKGYLKSGQLPNAEGMLRRSLQMDPQNASAHYLLGQTLMKAGRADEGRQMMQRAAQLRQGGAQ